MTKQTYLKNYKKYSAADYYLIGFFYKKVLYIGKLDELKPRFVAIGHAASKAGGGEKLNLYLPNKRKEELIRKGAIAICNKDEFDTSIGKGWAFEKLVNELCGFEWEGQDTVPFYKAGDITINGKEVQLKFEGAQIVAEKTLQRLKKGLTRQSTRGIIKSTKGKVKGVKNENSTD